jgi:hypothetical protein
MASGEEEPLACVHMVAECCKQGCSLLRIQTQPCTFWTCLRTVLHGLHGLRELP